MQFDNLETFYKELQTFLEPNPNNSLLEEQYLKGLLVMGFTVLKDPMVEDFHIIWRHLPRMHTVLQVRDVLEGFLKPDRIAIDTFPPEVQNLYTMALLNANSRITWTPIIDRILGAIGRTPNMSPKQARLIHLAKGWYNNSHNQLGDFGSVCFSISTQLQFMRSCT